VAARRAAESSFLSANEAIDSMWMPANCGASPLAYG